MEQEKSELSAENAETAEALPKSAEKKGAREAFKSYFTATRISYIAIFIALSYVLRLFDFTIIPAVPFMKIDFSNVFVMIAGFALGPVAGVIVGVVKECFCGITTTTAFVGEVANILIVLPYILIPSIIYKYKKGIKCVLISLLLGSIAQTLISFPVNLLLTFPAFFGFSYPAGMNFYFSIWYWAILFNLVKCALVSVAVMLLYKSVSRLIKFTNAKFAKLSKKRNNKEISE